jgi:CRISPR-associated endonuclease/helicase Cas3
MALGCGLSHEVADRLARAGALPDLGKADERFQIMLRGGDLLDAITKEPLGKGLARYKGRKPDLPIADTWPRGMRHESVSVAMTPPDDDPLLRHLIGTHHGYGRPSFPVVADPSPRLVRILLDDEEFAAMSDAGCLASVWEEQFESLVAMHGAWGLAYLEAILRLADHRCSEDEMNGEVDVA